MSIHEPTTPARLFEARPGRYLRRARGRETFAWSEGFPVEVIVKRVRGRGGRREHDNLEALRAQGLPVPRAITWSQEHALPFGRFAGLPQRSLVVMERIEHEETLRDRLPVASPSERARWSREVLEIVAAFHGGGWYHRDLYLQHFLIAPRENSAAPEDRAAPAPSAASDRDAPSRIPERLVLIDLGRARRRLRPLRRWFVKDLAALLHSSPVEVSAPERLRFLARYLDRRGITDRSQRRSFARAVVRKAARMAAHVPRDERTARDAEPASRST